MNAWLCSCWVCLLHMSMNSPREILPHLMSIMKSRTAVMSFDLSPPDVFVSRQRKTKHELEILPARTDWGYAVLLGSAQTESFGLLAEY